MADLKRRATTIQVVQFDPRLKTYINFTGIAILCATVFGIVLIPVWLLAMHFYLKKYFETIHCELTTRALHFKKGVMFQTERTVPLDKIQDLTFKEGPLLRYLGLSQLKVETAGQSVQGGADMSLLGIVDARKFREMVLDQRDEITDRTPSGSHQLPADPEAVHELAPLLEEIHQTLKRLEQKL